MPSRCNVDSVDKERATRPKPNAYPPWAPRFWGGMGVTDYARLLWQNRFRIHISKYPMTVLVGVCTLFNSFFSFFQWLFLARRIQKTKIKDPPIFIIGHWRSGTTLMHELLVLGDSRAYPNNFQAFVPRHFLVSGWLVYPLLSVLLPKKRPMDDMQLSVSAPQEDDFALISLGAPTPYRRIAFANSRNVDHQQLNLNQAAPVVTTQIKNALIYFFKALTWKTKKQLILKSPPHTGRIKQLAKWFPGAKFIHMSRHPHKMVPSTIRLWQLLEQTQGFQKAKNDQQALRDYVFDCKDLMYDAYLDFKSELPENQLIEVQFEKLIEDPEREIRRVHKQLELDGVEQLLPLVNAYFERTREHKTNRNQLDEDLRTEIDRHWSRYLQEFGYVEAERKKASSV